MRKTLEALQAKVRQALERAETLADSENETTSNRYTDVAGCLDETYDSLQAAIDALES